MAERSDTTTTTEQLEVTREVRIEALPETVFAFFTEPSKLMQWMGVNAELDPQPGGIYRVHVSRDWVARGEFVAVEPFVRVAFTWGWENGAVGLQPGASMIDVTLEPDGSGTIVRLVHSRLPDGEAASSHADGWEHFLGRLAVAASGGDPGPDPWATGAAE